MLIKYFILVLFLLIAANTAFAQQYWLPQSCPTTKILYRIIFVDTLFGWASGDSGAVIHTTDGGHYWAIQQLGATDVVDDMYFLDRQNGWALTNDYLTNGTHFYKTTNGGSNWGPDFNPDTNAYFLSVYYRDINTGYVGGRYGDIYRTTTGGASWLKCTIDSALFTNYPVRRIKFYNSSLGYACGGLIDIAGAVWSTSDVGLTWKETVISPEPDYDMWIYDSQRVIFVGGDFEYGTSVITSGNHGIDFKYDTIGCRGVGRAITFRTPSEAWIPLSNSQLWGVNLDSGAVDRWFTVPAPDSTYVIDATFRSPTFGWAVGYVLHNGFVFTGALMKYNASIIGISESHNMIPDNFELFQNYPNPFNPSTTIKYYVPKPSDVEIEFFDAAGRQVKTIREPGASRGYHSIVFNGSDLSSGIYFYRMTAGEYSAAKKMALIK